MKGNNSPNRKLVNTPSSKDISRQSQNDAINSDPLHSIGIIELLRKEVLDLKSTLIQRDAEIERLKGQNKRLQSSWSLSDKLEERSRKVSELQDELKQALSDSEKRHLADLKKFKQECQAKMAERPNLKDFFVQRQSSNTAQTETNALKAQLELMTKQYMEAQKRLAESKSGSQSSRDLESSFAEITKKIEGYKKQIEEKEDQNRKLQDEIAGIRAHAASVNGEIGRNKDIIKKLSAFIRRNWLALQSEFPKDQKLQNPAKSINEGSDIQEAKLKELEKYRSTGLKAMNDRLNEYAREEKNFIKEISGLNDQKDRITAESTRKQLEFKQEKANLNTKIGTLQRENKKNLDNCNDLAAKCSNLKIQNATQSNRIAQLEKQKKTNLDQIRALTDKNAALDQQIIGLDTDLNRTKVDLTLKTTQLDSAKKSIATLTSQKKTLTDNLSKTTYDLTTANATIATNKTRISTLEKTQIRLTAEVKTLQEIVKKLTNEKGRLEDEKRQKNQQIDVLKGRINKADSDISSLNYNLSREKDDHKKSLRVIENINKMMVGEASQLFTGRTKLLERTSPNESDKLQKEIEEVIKEWKASFRAVQFFNGSAIMPRESVSWMIDTLDQYMKETPVATRLIHRFDPLNATNFHQYIDDVPNLFVMVHLSNGAKIGGYTAFPVTREQREFPGKGFLFSITDSKVYQLNKNPRKAVVNYDEYFFILGNAELRLRQEKKEDRQRAIVFSTLGTANSTFDSMKDTRVDFLKTTDRTENDQPVDSFEFYEVIFER